MTTIDLVALSLAVAVVTLGVASIWVEPLRRLRVYLLGVTLGLGAYILGRAQTTRDEDPDDAPTDPPDPPADPIPDARRRRVDVDRAGDDDVAVDFEGGSDGRIDRLEDLAD